MTTVPPHAQADLALQGASPSPLSLVAGGNLSASSSIYNLSGATASSSSVGYYFSTDATLDAADQLLTSQFGGQLSPNFPSSRFGTAAVPPDVAPGAYFILFVADYQNQVGETDENNNVRAVSFTVSPPGVDLVITQEQLFPSSVVAGNFLQVNCLMVNQGNVHANTSTAGFYLSTN